VVQIAHGLAEHIGRYDEFARFLVGQGFVVCGNDHLGHGKSVMDETLLGIVDYGDHVNMLRDMNTLHKIMAKRYPGLPYFLFGHSMGSLLSRIYCGAFGEELTGAVFCGTGQVPQSLLSFKDPVTQIFDYLDPMGYGSNTPLSLVTRLGSLGLKEHDELSWLSRSRSNIAAYRADPLCGARSGNALNRELVTLAVKASDPELPFRYPYGFPVLMIAGAKDPVGQNGRGVLAAADTLEASGLEPEVILYPGDRHEVLNEDDREKVYEDVARFLKKVLDED
jgi:alpha-beta hydrolase superfamily lysophospholipase